MIEVLLLNDDHTPMAFVVEVLERSFDHDRESATRIMLWVRHHGVAVCGTYPQDIAAAKSAQAIESAGAHQHPHRRVIAPVRRRSTRLRTATLWDGSVGLLRRERRRRPVRTGFGSFSTVMLDRN
jgi:ATP-dependent Clp protease adapter protein ClpS